MSSPDTRIRRLRASAYRVPTEADEADGTLAWTSTTIVVVHAEVGAVEGLGWTYADAACVDLVHGVLAAAVDGRDGLDIPAAWQSMQRAIRNLGRPGLVSCAMSATEIALWDAAARVVGLPLCRLLGRARESVPVYGSGGFTSYDDHQLAAQLWRWAHRFELPAVKIKIGDRWGRDVDRDLGRVDLAREVVEPGTALYVDANGAYAPAQAVRVGRQLDERGVLWFEEPVSSDDLAGLRDVRGAVGADVTAGEYGYHLPYFAAMLDAGAVDCLQVDVTRCGGFGEWLRVAALAAARNREISGHCAQNLSAHVALATPNARHLEWFHDHDRVESVLFDGVLDPSGGEVRADLDRPGHGMRLKETDAHRFRIS
ncbi:enolase C-terminal domain-like protein [Saccharopolyspora sp. NPDC000359]|uniref:enolase C-terminal domain-like protein n=1 Tax=Saccharopolyspora sp. NPDC000359 TaxID=3154251 RepID=UPI0033254195